MREIQHNPYFYKRTYEQQEIIDLVCDHFPESGYPSRIVNSKKHIVIASGLIDLSMGYEHKDFKSIDKKRIYRVCIYHKHRLALVSSIDMDYPVTSLLINDDVASIATGIYGDLPKGQLFQYNISTKQLRTCSDNTRPLSMLTINNGNMEVFTLKTNGYHEGDYQLYTIPYSPSIHINYETEKNFRIISNEAYELLSDQEVSTVASGFLQLLIASARKDL